MKKYIGMDVHKATTVITVINELGRIMAEAIVETSPAAILDFISGQRGSLHVTFEECAQAAWLYDMLRSHVADLVVCDPRKITRAGNKADKSDARRLADLLRTNALTPVYHGEQSTRVLKELTQGYSCLVEDRTRVKNRLKALFRARGIACEGSGVYSLDEREQWLAKLDSPAVRARADRLCSELDCLEWLSTEAELDLRAEARKHPAGKILRSIPGIGFVRAAVIIGVAGTPVSKQEAVLELLRTSGTDRGEFGVQDAGGESSSIQEATTCSGVESELQPSAEVGIQECGQDGRLGAMEVLLRCDDRKWRPRITGIPDSRQENRISYAGTLEERRTL